MNSEAGMSAEITNWKLVEITNWKLVELRMQVELRIGPFQRGFVGNHSELVVG